MTITIYYGEQSNAPVLEPSNVFRQFLKEQNEDSNMEGLRFCPALRNFFKNTFSIRNIHRWTLIRNGDEFHSDTLDTNTFNRYFVMRNKKIGLFSMTLPQLFIVPNKSIEIELIQPSLSKSDINLKTVVIPGKFNPYNHIRPLECPFYFKNTKDKIDCKPDADLFYLKFCTDEKIIFKRFIVNYEFNNFINDNLSNKNFNDAPLPLKWWYEKNRLIKLRERSMEHIKNNLCD